jgi:hypothetical protein
VIIINVSCRTDACFSYDISLILNKKVSFYGSYYHQPRGGEGDSWDLLFSNARVHLERGTLVFVLRDLCLRAKTILAILHTLIIFYINKVTNSTNLENR